MDNNNLDLEKLRYPIGRFTIPQNITDVQISQWIDSLEILPTKLQALVENLADHQLETPYRLGGWTVRQVIHHIPDSHHHSYIRFKWAMTEDKPIIKAYDEQEWSSLFDARTAPIQMSLEHLKAIHTKLVYFLRGLTREDLRRTFIHPDSKVEVPLDENIGRYAWHGNHHYAHIEGLLKREGWS